eukprot:gene9834-11649_t
MLWVVEQVCQQPTQLENQKMIDKREYNFAKTQLVVIPDAFLFSHILKREAERFYETHVTQNRALGELDHPNPHSETFRSLTLENVSHRVLDYYWDGDDLVGYVEVLPTPAGAMLKDLYLAGCRLGMSSRGWATLKEKDGCVYIQDDFELI